MKRQAAITLVLLLFLVQTALRPADACPESPPEESGRVEAWKWSVPISAAPLMFIENVGQFDPRVHFQLRGGNTIVWLTDDAIWFTVMEQRQPDLSGWWTSGPSVLAGASPTRAARRGVHLRVAFQGAIPGRRLEAFGRLAVQVSYFMGSDPRQWRAGVPGWRGVRYRDLYPGIDLEITGADGRLTLRAIAAPDAAPERVRLSVEGADRLALAGDHLRLFTDGGEWTLPLLTIAGSQTELPPPSISGHLVASPFAAADPAGAESERKAMAQELVYAGFLAGSDDDHGNAVAVDASGAAYVAGAITRFDLPRRPGPFEVPDSPEDDALLLKVSPDGSMLAYAAFFGGSSYDRAFAVAVDGDGAAYVGGCTWSLDFPTTPGAFSPSHNGGMSDAFVVKVNPSGAALAYGTYLGGGTTDDLETVWDLAVDGDGAAFLTGWTVSYDFPTTVGAFDRSYNGDPDVFVTKLNPSGSWLAYSTFVGEYSAEKGFGIAALDDGTAIVAGYSYSYNFPTTQGAFDTTLAGCTDAFVLRLNAAGSDLVFSTFVGGSDCDYADGLAVDESGAAYITGETRSSDFPTTLGAFDRSYNGNVDAFVAKLKPAGSALSYATYFGGGRSDSDDAGWGIAVDRDGVAYVTGATRSADFPTTPGAFDVSHNGYFDLFLVKLAATGSRLTYATFVGGTNLDQGLDVKVDDAGMVYVTGDTESPDFPATPGVFGPDFGGGITDGLVAKFALKGWEVHSLYLPAVSRY